MASPNSKNPLPELDHKGFSRNPKTDWLLYLDKLTAWVWQDKEGSSRWTLLLDDDLRHASANHPPRTAAGLKTQVMHQSILKHALVSTFCPALPYHHLTAPEHRGARRERQHRALRDQPP